MTKSIVLIVIIFLSSCKHSGVTKAEIYSVVEFVIHDQRLNKNHSLKIAPGENLTNDSLVSLVEKTSSTKPSGDNVSGGKLVFASEFRIGLPKCLTKVDIEFMVQQREELKGFEWDSSKLGFNLKNGSQWYELSVPLFSQDKTKAIIVVEDLCEGLCGHGYEMMLIKVGGKWTS